MSGQWDHCWMAKSRVILAYLLNLDWLFFQVPVFSSCAGVGTDAGAFGGSESAMTVDRGFWKCRSRVWNHDHMKRHE
jgi:hypothetical protein